MEILLTVAVVTVYVVNYVDRAKVHKMLRSIDRRVHGDEHPHPHRRKKD